MHRHRCSGGLTKCDIRADGGHPVLDSYAHDVFVSPPWHEEPGSPVWGGAIPGFPPIRALVKSSRPTTCGEIIGPLTKLHVLSTSPVHD